MYREHFGLKELPFSIAPNPRYLYLTGQHQEALAHLVYGLNSGGGIILLTGEVGTGKTTISRKLLEDIPEHIDIAWIVNPKLSAEELLATICDELSIHYPKHTHSIKTLTDLINARLIDAHGQGRNVVLMIDEAQNLSAEVLEQLRLLTNLETNERKLLQIVLLGQPELKTMLERTDLRQLAQRITARYHLHPLNRHETMAYIRHRLAVGGCDRTVFSASAMKMIYRISHGTPRLINLLCDRAMLGVYSSNGEMVYPKHIRQSCQEVLGNAAVPKRALLVPVTVMALLLVAGIVFASGTWKQIPAYFEQAAMPGTHMAQPGALEPVRAIAPTAGLTPAPAVEAKQETAPATTATSPTPAADIIGKEGLKTAPTQVADMTPAAHQPPANTNRANDTAVEPEAKEGSNNRADTTSHHAVTQTVITPWDMIEKSGTMAAAFQTLAGIWHTRITPAAGDACHQLSDPGLLCLKQHANIWLIRAMNRPAIFRIIGGDKAPHYGVIRFISHGHAIIQLDQQQWRVSLSELKHHIQGQITLIWSSPPGFQKDIQQGGSGKAVAWLITQLDRIQGTMIPPRHVEEMDDLLVARLKDFQSSQGLPADGIAGVRTLMRINEQIGLAIPRLLQLAKR